MKKSVIFFLILCLAHFTSVSQSCLPEGITFQSQTEVDNFHFNYPGCTVIEGYVSFATDTEFTSLQGLCGLTRVNSDLYIRGTRLFDLSGLDSLTYIGGSFTLYHNDTLKYISSLANLDSIGGSLDFSFQDSLTSLHGLENLTYIGDSLVIEKCDSLKNLTGLENLTHTGDIIFIYWNTCLLSLDGLEGLDSIYSIYIHDNDALSDVSALGHLDTIPGYLSFGHNDNLPGFYGMTGIKSIIMGLRITNNDAIVDFEGFDSLAYTGFLLIGTTGNGGNDHLINLSGLQNLKYIGGDLEIARNQMLSGINALSGLDSIRGYIKVYNNDALVSLSGLDHISSKSITDLTITDNSSLSECDVESICYYLLGPNGEVDIQGNNTGCNSREEVEAACVWISIGEEPDKGGCTFYPNPADGIAHFTFRISQDQYVSLKIYDVQCREVATLIDGSKPAGEYNLTFGTSGLNAGVYFFRLQANSKITSGKMILMR